MKSSNVTRREFVSATSKIVAGSVVMGLMPGTLTSQSAKAKRRLAMVGTGIRGIRMWGKEVLDSYGESHEFVGLCDINPGRLEFGKRYIGAACPTFTDFDLMLRQTKPEVVIVTTVDGTHHTFITKAMQHGCDVITEKPLTTDEVKLKAILDAQKRSGKDITVTFNYRYSPHRTRIKQLLMEGRIGRVTSVDFNWYLDVYHGADYFRRWHRLRESGGTLLVHKSTHHFDLLNWWLDSDPEVIHGFGALEFYGKNNPFRHTHCRPCPHKDRCQFFWDMTKDERLMNLYAKNEQYDGYLRDGCVWKEDIDIFDKMAVQIRYANNVQVSYSLTTYSPYEGYRIAFNGTKGRIEAWIHERQPWPMNDYHEMQLTDNFGKAEYIRMPQGGGGHDGGDVLMMDTIFRNPGTRDPYGRAAGLRDGAMSMLIGIAARKSIDSGRPVAINELTDIPIHAVRPVG